MKKYSDAIVYGIGFGMVWYLLQLGFLQVEGQRSSQILVVVLVSAAMGLSSLIYTKENWSLLKQVVLHWGMIFGLVNVMGYVNGWLVFETGFYVSFFLQFLATYVLIWLVMYYLQGKRVKQINARLEQEKSER